MVFCCFGLAILRMVMSMNDGPRARDDLKQGLTLLLRAARTAAKQVNVGNIDRTLDQAFGQASRVVSAVGKVVAQEIDRARAGDTWSKSEQTKQEGSSAAHGADGANDDAGANGSTQGRNERTDRDDGNQSGIS